MYCDVNPLKLKPHGAIENMVDFSWKDTNVLCNWESEKKSTCVRLKPPHKISPVPSVFYWIVYETYIIYRKSV